MILAYVKAGFHFTDIIWGHSSNPYNSHNFITSIIKDNPDNKIQLLNDEIILNLFKCGDLRIIQNMLYETNTNKLKYYPNDYLLVKLIISTFSNPHYIEGAPEHSNRERLLENYKYFGNTNIQNDRDKMIINKVN